MSTDYSGWVSSGSKREVSKHSFASISSPKGSIILDLIASKGRLQGRFSETLWILPKARATILDVMLFLLTPPCAGSAIAFFAHNSHSPKRQGNATACSGSWAPARRDLYTSAWVFRVRWSGQAREGLRVCFPPRTAPHHIYPPILI